MEDSSYTSSVELGIMNDPFFFQQWHGSNSFDGFGSCLPPVSSSAIVEEVLNFKRSAEQLSQSDINRPFKQLKNEIQYSPNLIANNNNARKAVKPEQETWSPSSTLYFPSDQSFIINQNFIQGTDNNKMMSTNSKRLAHQSHDHILAERKRREKLSQRFIALSVLVPGLKKTDKASVLGDAVEYMKKLKEKVKILEEQTNKKKAIESVVFVKKYGLHESNESIGPVITETLPWVEARFCKKDILVHVHCEKNKGVLEKIVLEIEKLHLSVVNSSVMTFGDSALDITLIAQKDEDFTMSITQFIIELRRTLKLSM